MKYFLLLLASLTLLSGIYIYNYLSDENSSTARTTNDENMTVPSYLKSEFPKTDWSKVSPKIEAVISGGPGRDGIPAIDEPVFIPLSDYEIADDVQALVLQNEQETKVYPYNILTWHEIVNDTFGNTPVAVNFCPLCGSAIVYDRTLPDGRVSSFGVSGSLLESNMVMYDRLTESLWQQSTGVALAGTYLGEELSLVPFQLLSVADIKNTYPDAMVLSEETGYNRNYQRNPYAGYDTNNQFVFDPSNIDTRFAPKTIMVVFEADGDTHTTPWLALREAETKTYSNEFETYTLFVNENAELIISNSKNEIIPFYFEMWFSTAVQHGEGLIIIE